MLKFKRALGVSLLICAQSSIALPHIGLESNEANPPISLVQSEQQAQTFELVFIQEPKPLWSKKRYISQLAADNKGFRIWDPTPEKGAFNDGEMFKANTTLKLPYGRKLLSVDISVDEKHQSVWLGKILQFMVNGKELMPAKTNDGQATFELLRGEDGKYFTPKQTGRYWFEVPKGMTEIAFVNMMAAGAENFDVNVSNYKFYVWEEEDTRQVPYLLRVDRFGFLNDMDKYLVVEQQEWEKISEYPLFIQNAAIENTISDQPYSQSGRPLAFVDFSAQTKTGFYPTKIKKTSEVVKSKTTNKTFKVFEQAEHITAYRNDAWSAFWYLTDGVDGPYGDVHQQDAKAQVFNSDKTIDIRGGWFDAGDYGKYAVNGAWSTTLGLLSYLYAPEAYQFDIPANDEKIIPVALHHPERLDALSTLKFELDFLLKLQSDNGGVYHKAATAEWPSLTVTPATDTAIKTVLPVSSTATADFATTMLLAQQVFSQSTLEEDQAQAMVYQQAANAALAWLSDNPEMVMIEDRYDNIEYGGPYTDYRDTDERLLADVALWTSNKDEQLHEVISTKLAIIAQQERFGDQAPDWRDVNFLALFLYALHADPKSDSYQAVLAGLERFGQQQIKLQANNPWRIGIAGEGSQMNWGSNGVISTVALEQLWLYKLTGKREYLNSAYDMSHWFFGHNPVGMDFIVGKYAVQPKWPHFRPLTSGVVERPDGLIVGGPNSVELKGDTAAAVLQNLAPMQVYIDHQDSWATNEIAINWQVAFASYMTHLDFHLRNRN